LEAGLYRHKGQLCAARDTEVAEELYRKALNVAEEQEAKALGIARSRASRGSAATRVATPKAVIFSRRSAAGSPKASTPPI
jgi:hypothetical protein